MKLPGGTEKKNEPIVTSLILAYFDGPLDGLEQIIDLRKDDLMQVDGTIKAEIDAEVCRYYYESLVKYTPDYCRYPMNLVRAERLPEN